MSNQKKCFDQVLIETRKVNKVFGSGKKSVHAVKDMDFLLHKGEIVSIVGQSGSGKTTLAKILLGLLKETNGEIIYDGKRRDLSSLQKRRAYWQNIQAIFQDPFSTFNQFFRVEKILNDCLNLQELGHLSIEENGTGCAMPANLSTSNMRNCTTSIPLSSQAGRCSG